MNKYFLYLIISLSVSVPLYAAEQHAKTTPEVGAGMKFKEESLRCHLKDLQEAIAEAERRLATGEPESYEGRKRMRRILKYEQENS